MHQQNRVAYLAVGLSYVNPTITAMIKFDASATLVFVPAPTLHFTQAGIDATIVAFNVIVVTAPFRRLYRGLSHYEPSKSVIVVDVCLLDALRRD